MEKRWLLLLPQLLVCTTDPWRRDGCLLQDAADCLIFWPVWLPLWYQWCVWLCVFGLSTVWLLSPSLKCRDCFSVWRILNKVSFPCCVSGSPPLTPLIWQGVLFCKETCLFILIESGLWFMKKVVFEYSWKVFF